MHNKLFTDHEQAGRASQPMDLRGLASNMLQSSTDGLSTGGSFDSKLTDLPNIETFAPSDEEYEEGGVYNDEQLVED